MTPWRKATLAVVRCGDASLHRSWSGPDRAFDVGVSYFGNNPAKAFPEARFVHRYKGGKWDGLFDFFLKFPDALDAYDYFWFPDDDIAATANDINRLVEIGTAYGLEVFQPALDDESYYSHVITLRHPSFNLRYTNFVEIMAPVISRAVLTRTLPMLDANRSGFGIDFVWPEMAADISGEPIKSTAIVDSVTVRHTRPVGGSLHKFMNEAGGVSAVEEMAKALSIVKGPRNSSIKGVPTPRITIRSGMDRAGNYLQGYALVSRVLLDLLLRHTNRAQPVKFRRVIKLAFA